MSFGPAGLARLLDRPAVAPVAGASLLWVSNTDNDSFHSAAGAISQFVTSRWFSFSRLRSHALFPVEIPTPAPSGEVPMCMVHKAAQEASRRTTPARALTHAVAPPLDRTYRER